MLAAIWGFMWLFSSSAGAIGLHEQATKAADIVNPLNTVWTLVTAFLVFFMQAGFMMLEGGFARTREVSNVMIECIADTGMCGVLFWAFGFAFMFGPGNGWIGYHYFFLQGIPHTYGTTGSRSWRSSSSSSRSPTPRAPSSRARWSDEPTSRAT